MESPICISNCIRIDFVLLYVSKQSAQHVYRLLELEVKRYLRDHTPYLKDPSLPDSTSAPLFGILTNLPFARPYRELASSIQNVLCLERPSSETCMCHPCSCVGTTDLPDPQSWYEALCFMPKLKTFSVEVAHREKDLKEIHLAAIGVGKRLLEEKRIEAFYLLSPKLIGNACALFTSSNISVRLSTLVLTRHTTTGPTPRNWLNASSLR